MAEQQHNKISDTVYTAMDTIASDNLYEAMKGYSQQKRFLLRVCSSITRYKTQRSPLSSKVAQQKLITKEIIQTFNSNLLKKHNKELSDSHICNYLDELVRDKQLYKTNKAEFVLIFKSSDIDAVWERLEKEDQQSASD